MENTNSNFIHEIIDADLVSREVGQREIVEAFPECAINGNLDRKKLRECMSNCKEILFAQIAECDADLILTMGQYPTECILGEKVNKLRDYVGKEYDVSINGKNKKVIPIYHTSPANPLCFKGNVSIFENISLKYKFIDFSSWFK